MASDIEPPVVGAMRRIQEYEDYKTIITFATEALNGQVRKVFNSAATMTEGQLRDAVGFCRGYNQMLDLPALFLQRYDAQQQEVPADNPPEQEGLKGRLFSEGE